MCPGSQRKRNAPSALSKIKNRMVGMVTLFHELSTEERSAALKIWKMSLEFLILGRACQDIIRSIKTSTLESTAGLPPVLHIAGSTPDPPSILAVGQQAVTIKTKHTASNKKTQPTNKDGCSAAQTLLQQMENEQAAVTLLQDADVAESMLDSIIGNVVTITDATCNTSSELLAEHAYTLCSYVRKSPKRPRRSDKRESVTTDSQQERTEGGLEPMLADLLASLDTDKGDALLSQVGEGIITTAETTNRTESNVAVEDIEIVPFFDDGDVIEHDDADVDNMHIVSPLKKNQKKVSDRKQTSPRSQEKQKARRPKAPKPPKPPKRRKVKPKEGEDGSTQTPRPKREQKTPVFTSEECTCPDCGKMLSNPSNMKVHRRAHMGLRPFNCSLCEKCFTTLANKQRHERYHRGERPFQCEFCSEKFCERKTLDVHRRRHTGEKPYRCSVCGKTFSQLNTMKNHQNIHIDFRSNVCEICGAAFIQRSQLRTHIKRHYNIKPHKCPKCAKKFVCKGDMERHKLTHQSKQINICQICNKTFSRMEYLRDHMNVHTGRDPFHCHKCPDAFLDKSTLRKHLQEIHKMSNVPDLVKVEDNSRAAHVVNTIKVECIDENEMKMVTEITKPDLHTSTSTLPIIVIKTEDVTDETAAPSSSPTKLSRQIERIMTKGIKIAPKPPELSSQPVTIQQVVVPYEGAWILPSQAVTTQSPVTGSRTEDASAAQVIEAETLKVASQDGTTWFVQQP